MTLIMSSGIHLNFLSYIHVFDNFVDIAFAVPCSSAADILFNNRMHGFNNSSPNFETMRITQLT